MGINDFSESEIKWWLTVILNDEIESLQINGVSEKGTGQCGEVIFVTVTTTDKTKLTQKYDLALKNSKSNTALMSQSPTIRDAFINEAYMYQEVFPVFKQFQVDRGVENVFNSVPICYGVFSDESKHIIALENLQKIGYDMWDSCRPLTRKHIDLVVEEYGRFHATSVAMQELEPEKFQKLVEGFTSDVYTKVFANTSTIAYFKNNIQDLYSLLKSDFEEDVLKKLLDFKEQVHFVFCDLTPDGSDLKVITHGDCWSNNFMYKYDDEDETAVSKVIFLDWQISRLSSPFTDLSYFLFECVSEEDIASIDSILKVYYDSFCSHLSKFGSTLTSKYSLEDFSRQWKKFSKYGLIMSLVLIKASYTRKQDWSTSRINYKNRVKPIVKYVVDNEIGNIKNIKH